MAAGGTDLLFVYGTLREDVPGSVARLLGPQARSLGPASVAGRLVLLDGYPGLVPGHDPGERARGELLELADPRAILARLDEYEGCGPADAPPHEFVRARLPVTVASGRIVDAWAYVYAGPVEGRPAIPSGDFLDVAS